MELARALRRNSTILLAAVLVPVLIAASIFMPTWHKGKPAHARHAVSQQSVPTTRAYRASKAGPIYYRDRVIVLMYHNISPQPGGSGTITPGRFSTELVMLKKKGFNFIGAPQLAAFLDKRPVSLPPNALLLSFDDGYHSTYQYALPVLKREHAPAVVFIIEGFMGTKPGMLTWPEVVSLEKSGLFTIGGHTYDQHYRVPGNRRLPLVPITVTPITRPGSKQRETEAAYIDRMQADSFKAQHVLMAELGHTTPYFAYPYGAYNPELVRVLHRAGYRYLFTVIRGINTRDQDAAHIYRVNAGSPWVTPGRLYTTIRYIAIQGRLQHHPPATWVRS